MRVQVRHRIGRDRRIAHRVHHREPGACAIFRRRGDVIRIAAHAETDQLGVDSRAAGPSVFEFLEHHDAAAIGRDEAVTITIPGPGGLGGGIISGGQRLRLAEAADAERGHRHLRAAGEDHIGIAVLDRAHAEADGMGGGGAGRHHAEVRAAQAVLDRQVPGDHVDDRARNEERRDLARAVGREIRVVFALDRGQATDAGAGDHAAALRVDLRQIEPAVGEGLDASRHAVVHELVHAAGFLRRDVVPDVEVLDATAELRREVAGIEFGDGGNAALAAQDRFPGGRDRTAQRGDDSKASDDDAAFAHAVLRGGKGTGSSRLAGGCRPDLSAEDFRPCGVR